MPNFELLKTLAILIIPCHANPSVDWCEENPELANSLHVDVTKTITDSAKKINSKLIYLSTEWVFWR